MADTPRDQPSKVSTEDALRPPDQSVVTSDSPQADESREDGPGKKDAATDKKSSPNDQDSATDKTSKKPRRRRSPQRRIKKLNAELGESQSLNETQAGRIQELEQENQALKSKSKAPEPKLKDFDSPQEYAKAFAKWDKPAAAPPAKKAPAKKATTTASPIEDEDIADFNRRGQEKLGDEFVEASQAKGNAVNAVMGEYMLDHDLGPEIYVHLSNNQKEARKICDMVPHKAVKAMDDLAAKAKAGELDVGEEGELNVEDRPDPGESDNDPKKTPKDAKKPGKQTKAPTPPDDTKGGTAHRGKTPDEENMEEYAARRTREERKAAGLPPI